MGEIKKSLDLSNHPFSKSSWAALSSLSFTVLWGREFSATVATIREAVGWKSRLFGQSSARWFTADLQVFEDRGYTRSSWIDFFLVSLLDSTQVGIQPFQHVPPYYPSRSKQKEIEFTFVAGNKLLWSGHEKEKWLQCCESNQGPLEPHRALCQTSKAFAMRDDNFIRDDQAKERYDQAADKIGA